MPLKFVAAAHPTPTLAMLALLVVVADHSAVAQIAHHPFAVGASEGGVGHQNALGAWILSQESRFYLGLTHAVRETKASPAGALGLIALSFAYGVFHAAGPGHGKAVITSYMVSNEVALRRGIVIALLAALLQGVVATSLVGIAAFAFHATAPTMTAAAQSVELASYLGIVALGLFLVVRKGRAALAALRVAAPSPLPTAFAAAGLGGSPASRFIADDGRCGHDLACDCGHAHIPDPALLSDARFDWKAAGLAIATAGARPCSGAILVLVFALSQEMFVAGVGATFAMSLGTGITTSVIACIAVFAKDLALRLPGASSHKAAAIGRIIELVAAACVLVFGAVLLATFLSGVRAGG